MKNRKITIENRIVHISGEVSMSISEIADLFQIFYQTAKREIRVIEKSGVVSGNYSLCCVCDGSKIYPDYYGLEMIIALSFRVQSRNAELFRKWLLKKTAKTDILKTPRMLILSIYNSSLN